MPASIGVNLRVTGHCRQGGRKYMEDFFSVAYQQTEDERDLEYAFFGIYDGHGGAEAAAFAKERLMEAIVRHKYFWSDNDEEVLRAIKLGYIATHYAMWKEQDKWPKTASGLPSTAGTTASIAFIRRGKIYVGHVGDSAIVLGYQEPGCNIWKAKPLTRDHKPECAVEMSRITQCGGKVVSKSGVPRVVWNRPRIGHKGPVRRSTPIDEIPFLAVARSLGDLWSYNSEMDEFVVSPDPDCSVIPIDTTSFRCLIFGTDGLYNMLSPQMAVHIVQQAEEHNEEAALSDAPNKIWLNPSKCLVERALKLWSTTKMRADNTSVVTLMLDPPGPPRAQVLRNRKKSYPDSGLQIVTRYQDEEQRKDHPEQPPERSPIIPEHNPHILKSITSYRTSTPTKNVSDDNLKDPCSSFDAEPNKNFVLKPRESLSFDPKSDKTDIAVMESETDKNGMNAEQCLNCKKNKATGDVAEVSTSSFDTNSPSDSSIFSKSEENIQINEISSSSNEVDEEENKVKTNFNRLVNRKGRLRVRTENQSKNDDNKGLKTRKRRATEPLESSDLKKAKKNISSSHNLRLRKASAIETEMVNQVDSTNKDLNRIKRGGTSKQVVTDSIVRTRKSRLEPGLSLRTSQRLKQNDSRVRSKQKLNVIVSDKRNEKDTTKELLLLENNNNKSDKTDKSGVNPSRSIPKSKVERLKRQRKRTFKVGYLRKLRRNISSRNQKM